jgi:hypothetical protein
MKLTVVHDKKGNKAGSNFVEVGVIPGKGQLKLDVEFTAEMSTLDIYKQYRVDRAKSKLVKLKKPRKMPSQTR